MTMNNMAQSIEKATARKERKAKRNCFNKRTATLFKKASEVHQLTKARITISVLHEGQVITRVYE